MCLKRNTEESSNFSPKPWTNPSKNANFKTALNRYFNGQERLVFYLESHQTIFIGQMCLKKEKEQANLKFLTKTMRLFY